MDLSTIKLNVTSYTEIEENIAANYDEIIQALVNVVDEDDLGKLLAGVIQISYVIGFRDGKTDV